MTLLSWSNQYLIGEPTIDKEHHELFDLINAFHTHWQEDRKRSEIANILSKLVKYAELHFQHEEAIMATAGYPLLDEHRAVHEKLFLSIFQLNEGYMNNLRGIEMDTMKFVRDWLIQHIINNDYLFRDFLVRKKQADAQGTNAKPD